MLLISVMDGFINDFEPGKRKGLVAREISEMVAWDSVTGHHMGLTNALKPFLKTIKRRVDEGGSRGPPARHRSWDSRELQ